MKQKDYEHDDDDDELPVVSITSNASMRALEMPSAAELARQREREMDTERALRELHARHASAGVILRHSDSSGSSSSEGELALAQVVSELRLIQPPPAVSATEAGRARLHTLLQALLQPSRAIPALMMGVVCSGVTSAAYKQHLEGAVYVTWCGWVCGVGALGGAAGLPRGVTARARRTLHHLLDTMGTAEQISAVSASLGVAARASTDAAAADGERRADAARVCVRLADAARSGAGAQADALAELLLKEAMHGLVNQSNCSDVMEVDSDSSCLALESVLDSACDDRLSHGAALVAAGRLLALQPRYARTLLPRLAVQTCKDRGKFTPGKLKVDVAIRRLQVLFGSRHLRPHSNNNTQNNQQTGL